MFSEALRSGLYSSADDVIDRALEVLHEQDAWLLANGQVIDAQIRKGLRGTRSRSRQTSFTQTL